MLAQGLLSMSLLLTYPLQFYVAAEVTLIEVGASYPNISYPDYWEMFIKAAMVLLTCEYCFYTNSEYDRFFSKIKEVFFFCYLPFAPLPLNLFI